jgi:hypothetical protein
MKCGLCKIDLGLDFEGDGFYCRDCFRKVAQAWILMKSLERRAAPAQGLGGSERGTHEKARSDPGGRKEEGIINGQ